MPSYIVCLDKEEDLKRFIIWSSIVDNITYGPVDALDMMMYLSEDSENRGVASPLLRIERARKNGTSGMHPGSPGGYDSSGMVVDGKYWLSRQKLAAYADGDHSVLEEILDEEEE